MWHLPALGQLLGGELSKGTMVPASDSVPGENASPHPEVSQLSYSPDVPGTF